ncbi:MAG: cupin domain-containing protein [Rhodospirillaceae bacterium]|jgi:ferredoxin-NADP reductase/quercetin dioxygenase-like cupin family protein|nr:cupin domain-containing protein [Rhodospirillaceae bacterium]MBT4939542.1 cupin domain-containing protein [Rhodospirillaceae bacterium]MBT5938377.1 cupin domain-containing protein [Rhodospirillaceae bacterium]MBT7265416.1 cupin domain-containing protein [Rhodospirillaceae bacterium]
MALSEFVEIHELADLTEFSEEERIRKKLLQSKGTVCEFVSYVPGQNTVLHKHPMQDEIFYVVQGTGLITFEEQDDIAVKAGSVVFVPAGTVHGIATNDKDKLVVMFTKGPGVTGKAAKALMSGEIPPKLSSEVEIHELADLTEFSEEERIRKKLLQSKGTVCEFVSYIPGQNTVLHKHPMQDEIFYVVQGTGLITFEEQEDIAVKEGSVVFVPAGTVHGIATNDRDKLVVMFTKGPGVTGKAVKAFMQGEKPAANTDTLKLRTTAIENLTPDIKRFVFESADGSELPAFTAGAHLTLHLGNDLRRCYSLANDPADRSKYVTGILKDPNSKGGSEWMHTNVSVGDVLTVDNPLNNFELAKDAGEHILLAGGIGITPMMSMGHHLKTNGKKVHLHYCTKSVETTAFKQEIDALFGDDVTYHHDGGDPANGINLAEVLKDTPEGRHLYICGPGGLINAARDKSLHWPAGTVHFEVFANTATEADDENDNVAFDIELSQSNLKLTVPKDKSILQVLRSNGKELNFSCEEGYCGSCAVGLLSGKADHRDVVLSEEDRKTKIQACVARAMPGETLVLDI